SCVPAPEWSVPWTVTIDSSGRCVRTGRRLNDRAEACVGIEDPVRTLPAADIHALLAVLADQRFDQLDSCYEISGVTDVDRIVLTHADGAVVHQVRVDGPGLLAWRQPGKNYDIEPISRFLAVTCEVLRLAPSPNPAQTPARYAEGVADR